MIAYFQLQLKMTNRKLTEFGLPPLLAYPIITACFLFASNYLFLNTEFAAYFYVVVALWFLLKLTDKKRNQFLKLSYGTLKFRKLRVLENLLIILPFVLYLIYAASYQQIFILCIVAIALAFINLKTNYSFALPTPFYKVPFEFIVGFRSTFMVFIGAYILTYIAVTVPNFNLGVFALLLVFLLAISFYSKLENEIFIWSYSLDSEAFLQKKTKTGLWQVSILSTPVALTLLIFFSTEWEIILAALLLGYAYLALFIIAKYANYPKEISLPLGILLVVSMIFPFLLIGVIPYLYSQSTKRLNTILQ